MKLLQFEISFLEHRFEKLKKLEEIFVNFA